MLSSSKQDYLAARAAYNAAENDLEQTKIFAPFDGKMGALAKNINIGSTVSTSQSLVQIINLEKIFLFMR